MNPQHLRKKIEEIDTKDYGLYQSLLGEYEFPSFKLIIDQIPKDPYAPSHTGIYRIVVKRSDPRIIDWNIKNKTAEIAFCDFIARLFYKASKSISRGRRGTGNSGIITINRPEQVILQRNNVIVDDKHIEIRSFVGLPAKGRKINALTAQKMLLNELPEIVETSLFERYIDSNALKKHIETAEDADFLRKKLPELGLTAFIANGAILPRESGLSDKPLIKEAAITFQSPESLEIRISLPHGGTISGTGIPQGITLIAGGGFHGKSTLLEAIEMGIYNHIPDDGREYCVSLPQTVKIRAYSGRSISKTDISPFISNLPYGKETKEFSSENASGSTSQAAAIVESIEAGAKVLLMDEDTCAANFMIRDEKMRQLVKENDEPITPFVDRIRQLYDEKNISTILVLGGSGDYFAVSDYVIQMRNYRPLDTTRQAHEIAPPLNSRDKRISEKIFSTKERIPLSESINSLNEYKKKRIVARDTRTLIFGKQIIDLSDLEQIVELSQVKTIGYAIDYAKKYMDKKTALKNIADRILLDINQYGLDILTNRNSGDFACFRGIELAAAINRMRRIKMRQKSDNSSGLTI